MTLKNNVIQFPSKDTTSYLALLRRFKRIKRVYKKLYYIMKQLQLMEKEKGDH